jgi:hypothetical protein
MKDEFVVVPREPTREMLAAAYKTQGDYLGKLGEYCDDRSKPAPDLCALTYAAMLAAAPASQAAGAVDEGLADDLQRALVKLSRIPNASQYVIEAQHFVQSALRRLTPPSIAGASVTEAMVEWKDLPAPVLETMREIGNFAPTTNVRNREVKGYTLDGDGEAGKTYYQSPNLRQIATHLCVVADWLDRRAALAVGGKEGEANG